MIYFTPEYRNKSGIFDADIEAFSTVDTQEDMGSVVYRHSPMMMENTKIILFPQQGQFVCNCIVGAYDIYTNNIQKIHISGMVLSEYSAYVHMPNSNLMYASPFGQTIGVLEMNPDSDDSLMLPDGHDSITLSKIQSSPEIEADVAYFPAVLASNGGMYFILAMKDTHIRIRILVDAKFCPLSHRNSFSSVSITSLNSNSYACKCNVGYTGPDNTECNACSSGTYKTVTGSSPCFRTTAGTAWDSCRAAQLSATDDNCSICTTSLAGGMTEIALVGGVAHLASRLTRDSIPQVNSDAPEYQSTAGPGPSGQKTGAVVFNSNHYLDAGQHSMRIGSYGFTAVAVVMFTGKAPVRSDGDETKMDERIFEFGNGGHLDVIQLQRYQEFDLMVFSISHAGSICSFQSSGTLGQMPQNRWHTIVAQYNPKTYVLSLRVGDEYSSTKCPPRLDRTFSKTYVGKSQVEDDEQRPSWWSDGMLQGRIAGLYVVDMFLSSQEVSDTINDIYLGNDLFDTWCGHACDPGYSIDMDTMACTLCPVGWPGSDGAASNHYCNGCSVPEDTTDQRSSDPAFVCFCNGVSNMYECVCARGYTGDGSACTPRHSVMQGGFFACIAGFTLTTSLADPCGHCSAGKFKADTGNQACDDCPDDTYADETGAIACGICPHNRVPTSSRMSCECRTGWYSSSATPLESACEQCNEHSSSTQDFSGCTCIVGYSSGANIPLQDGSSCVPCATNMDSPGGTTLCTCTVSQGPGRTNEIALVPGVAHLVSRQTSTSAPPDNEYTPGFDGTAGPGPSGRETGAVVFNSNLQYLDAGEHTMSIANNGCTAVAVVMFTGSDFLENECLLDFGDSGTAHALQIKRRALDPVLAFSIKNENNDCYITISESIVQNTWHTMVAQYNAETLVLSLRMGDKYESTTCSSSRADRTFSKTYVGKGRGGDNGALTGKIAGLYVVDKFLTPEEVSDTINCIYLGNDLFDTWCYQACDSGYSIDMGSMTCTQCPTEWPGSGSVTSNHYCTLKICDESQEYFDNSQTLPACAKCTLPLAHCQRCECSKYRDALTASTEDTCDKSLRM